MKSFLARFHHLIKVYVLYFIGMISLLALFSFSPLQDYQLTFFLLVFLLMLGFALSLARFYGIHKPDNALLPDSNISIVLSQLVRNFPWGIGISGPDGNLLFFNEDFIEETFHNKGVIIEQTTDDEKPFSLLDTSNKEMKSFFKKNITARKERDKLLIHYDDGHVIELHHQKLTQQSSSHHLWIFYDLTDTYEVNKVLHELSGLRSAKFELIPEAMASFDEDGIFLETNKAFRELFSEIFPWESNTKISCYEFDQKLEDICIDNCQFEKINYSAAIKSHRQIRNAGDIFDLLQFKAPQNTVIERTILFSDTISSLGGIISFRDITRQYEIETMKSQFLSTAAHELRTPMANIFGYTELLINQSFTADKQSEILTVIYQQTKKLVNILNDLLDLTRIEARANLSLHYSSISINDLISTTLLEQAPTLAEHQVEFIINGDVAFMCDQEKLNQAMINVLSNAVKYSEKSSKIKIVVGRLVKDQVPGVQLQFTDFGRGMTRSQLSKAFEPFYRVDDGDTTTGTGLGLPITKQIIELHNGAINLSSLPGEGTTVTIWLPLQPGSLKQKKLN